MRAGAFEPGTDCCWWQWPPRWFVPRRLFWYFWALTMGWTPCAVGPQPHSESSTHTRKNMPSLSKKHLAVKPQTFHNYTLLFHSIVNGKVTTCPRKHFWVCAFDEFFAGGRLICTCNHPLWLSCVVQEETVSVSRSQMEVIQDVDSPPRTSSPTGEQSVGRNVLFGHRSKFCPHNIYTHKNIHTHWLELHNTLPLTHTYGRMHIHRQSLVDFSITDLVQTESSPHRTMASSQ